MKRLLAAFALALSLTPPLFAGEPIPPAPQAACQALKDQGATAEQLAQRGCCSWHGGVCGCTGGRAACCDGALSPSCGCHQDTPKDAKAT